MTLRQAAGCGIGVHPPAWRRLSTAVGLTLAAAAVFVLDPTAALAAAPARPQIDAAAAVVVDARDGHILYGRRARTRRPVASTTKLMTALVSLERLRLGQRLIAPGYDAGPAESLIDLQPGERMTVRDLLRALLLESANDAAVTLASGAAPSVNRFVRRMNQRARQLNLVDTHYANPVGLDQPGNFSSALDLSRLSRILLRNRTFAEIVDLPSARLESGSRSRVVDNRNDLVGRYSWIDGVKTGHTARAGFVLIGAGRRNGVRLVSVVMGAPSELARDQETLTLLRYGFSLYRRVRLLHAGGVEASPRVAYYGDRRTDLIVPRGAALAVRRGERARKVVQAPSELEGPIERGKTVGKVTLLLDNKRVRVVPLVTAEKVPRAGLPRRVSHVLLRALLIGAALAAAVLLALRVRKRRALGASTDT